MLSNSQNSAQSSCVGGPQSKERLAVIDDVKTTESSVVSERTFVVRPEAASHMMYK